MKNFFLKAMALLAVVAMFSCNDDDSDASSGPVSVSIQSEPATLGNSMGAEAAVPVTTDGDNLSVFVSVGNNWLSASMSGKTLTVKALSANDGPERTGEVTITARNGSNKATATLIVIQSNLPAAAVAFDPATLPLLGKTEGSSFNVDVVTATENTVAVDIPLTDRTWLAASVDGHTLTFTARRDNPDVLRKVSQVKVRVTGPDVSRTDTYITVIQEGAPVNFTADETTVEIGHVAGSKVVLAFETDIVEGIAVNADLSDVSDWIEASAFDYTAKTITLTTLSDTPTPLRTGTVTVSLSDDYPDIDPIVFTVNETEFPDASLSFDPDPIPVLGKMMGDAFDLNVITEADNTVEVEMQYSNWLDYAIDGKKLTFTAKIDNTGFAEKTLPVTIKVSGHGVTAKSETITIRQAPTEVIFSTVATTATLAGTLDATADVAVTTNILSSHGISFDFDGAAWLGATFNHSTGKIILKAIEANPGALRSTAFKAWPTDFPDKIIELTVNQSYDVDRYPKVGDVYRKDGIEGVIFWMDAADPTQAKIVGSMYQNSLWSRWCDNTAALSGSSTALSSYNYGLTVDQYRDDGEVNVGIIKNWIETNTQDGENPSLTLERFYHIYACDMLDDDKLQPTDSRWYVPAFNELNTLLEVYHGLPYASIPSGAPSTWTGANAQTALANRAKFEAAMKSLHDGTGNYLNEKFNAETPESDSGTSYGTSSHATNARIYYIRFGSKTRSETSTDPGGAKSTTGRALRCIKKVTLDPIVIP